MVYLWAIPNNYPERLLGEYQRDKSPDRFEFRKGIPLPDGLGMPRFKFRTKLAELEEAGDLCNNTQIPLVSPEVAAVLEEYAAASVQFFATEVEAGDGFSDRYKLVNVTKTIRGLDREQSQYTNVPGTDQIMGFRRAIYKEDCMGSLQLARDEEYKGHILVNEELATRLRALGRNKGIGLYSPAQIYESQ
jgi:hypothetical protein